mmetsp:Transcript_27362/g.72271  ORF Transcript_27362/g.72271 Transcript_27362/m.72271 type:complete len:459 (+) Transcript_27362:464-1840(+)
MVEVEEVHDVAVAEGRVNPCMRARCPRLTLAGVVRLVVQQVHTPGNHVGIQRQGRGRHGGLRRRPDPRQDVRRGLLLLLLLLAEKLGILVLVRVTLGLIGLSGLVQARPLLQVAEPLLLRDGRVQRAAEAEAVHRLLQPRALACGDRLRDEAAVALLAGPPLLGRALRGVVRGLALLPSGGGGDRRWRRRVAAKQSCEARAVLHQELADLWDAEDLVIPPAQRVAARRGGGGEHDSLGTVGDVLANLPGAVAHGSPFPGRLDVALRGLGERQGQAVARGLDAPNVFELHLERVPRREVAGLHDAEPIGAVLAALILVVRFSEKQGVSEALAVQLLLFVEELLDAGAGVVQLLDLEGEALAAEEHLAQEEDLPPRPLGAPGLGLPEAPRRVHEGHHIPDWSALIVDLHRRARSSCLPLLLPGLQAHHRKSHRLGRVQSFRRHPGRDRGDGGAARALCRA